MSNRSPEQSTRTARSIRLPSTLWAVLDEAALAESAKSGQYQSANALLETILEARLRAPPAAPNGGTVLERMRRARAAKATQDQAHVQRLAGYLEALATASVGRQRRARADAKAVVKRWRDSSLASPQYIDAWTRLLEMQIASLQRALRNGFVGLTPQALAANSPFAITPR